MSDLLDPSTQQQSQQTQQQAVSQSPVDMPEFLKGVQLEPELLNEPAVKNMKDLASLVKSYVHSQKMIGKDKVVIPSKDATPEQWSEVFTKLGLPKKEEYKLTKSEKSVLGEEFYNKASELGHAMGILPHQMQGFIAKLEEDGAARAEASASAFKKASEEAWNNLKTEWGDAYDAKFENAKAVLTKFSDDKTNQWLKETGLSADPRMVRLLEKFSSVMKEARIIEGKDDSGSPANLQERLNTILNDKNHPYWNKDNVGHAAAAQEVQGLFAKLHG